MHYFRDIYKTARNAAAAVLLSGAAAGYGFCSPAPEPVRAGDTVAVQASCRTPDGILVAVSDRESGQKAVRLWRDVFLLDETLTAGPIVPAPAGAPTPEETKAAIQERLAAYLIGMQPGASRQVTLTAEPRQGLPEADRFLTMARVWRHPLQREVALERFLSVTGQEAPQLGIQARFEPGIPRQVTAFDDQRVTLSVALSDGDAVDTPLGPGSARLTDDGLAVEVRSQPGDLVSMGPFLGQVDRVDEKLIRLDFGHPFGGRALECTLRVEAVTARAEPEPAIPALAAGVLPWMSDYLAAAARAHREQKPMVVLLTAEWCPWCREMQSRTLTDPRLVRLHDRYVWVRVDVDQDPETAAHFDRQAVPLLVVLDAAGSEVRRFEGFTEAGPLFDVLAPTPADESAPAAGRAK